MAWAISSPTVGLGVIAKASPDVTDYEAFNSLIAPRSIDLFHYLLDLESAPLYFGGYPTWAETLDATMLATMSPDTLKLTDFTGGAFDTTGLNSGGLRGLALAAVSLGEPIILRLAHEFNGDFGQTYGYPHETAAQFVAAWRHIHGVFAAAGATNVLWFWCPNIWPDAAEVDPTIDDGSGSNWYPGDSYVDIIGLDGYMNTLNTSVAAPADLFLANYAALTALAPTKPFALGEFGVATQSRLSALGGKAGWYDLFFEMVRNDMPKCLFVCQWQRSDVSNDYTINSSGSDAGAARRFVSGVLTPRFVASIIKAETGLRLAGEITLDSGILPSVSFFTVPLSITFATADAPANSATGSSRVTLVNGEAGARSVSATQRITSVV